MSGIAVIIALVVIWADSKCQCNQRPTQSNYERKWNGDGWLPSIHKKSYKPKSTTLTSKNNNSSIVTRDK